MIGVKNIAMSIWKNQFGCTIMIWVIFLTYILKIIWLTILINK
jgi:hypothetical protein